MITVLAEKPSVAKDLARIMGANESCDGFIKGNNYFFTWGFGHLIQLANPEEYGFGNFSDISSLPMLPESFKIGPKLIKEGKKYVVDPGVEKQLKTIKSLFDKSEKIIVATDAGREGELIFRYIYDYFQCKKPFVRLWISSQTDEAVINGFNNLQPGHLYDNLYYAAKCRSEADWLIGLNATRALSAASKSNLVLSIGRVQTPTLGMICRRYLEHENFVATDYYKLNLQVVYNGSTFNMMSVENFESITLAEQIQRKISASGTALVTTAEKVQKNENPPKLHDLTSLQREASRKLKLSPDRTLEVAQALYESKLITYPRTGSTYIGEDVFSTIPNLINAVAKMDTFKEAAQKLIGSTLTKGSVNDKKVTDHHALLPTGLDITGKHLNSEQMAVYELITVRMLEAFSQKCEKLVYTIMSEAAGEVFRASSTTIVKSGWRSIRNDNAPENDGDEEELSQSLPNLEQGANVSVDKISLLAKKTQPKPLLTMDTLLEMMENCGKKIEDEQQREAMKDLGLGTPATRASIIKTLLTREYIMMQKNSVVPTPLGLSIFNIVKSKAVGNPVLTGQWEQKLEEISLGKFPANAFMRAVYDYTKTITADMLAIGGGHANEIATAINSKKIMCPKCKNGQIIGTSKVYFCSEKNVCDFKLFTTIAKKELSENHLLSLLTQGKTGLIKGFISKSEKEFDAFLEFDQNFEITFSFPKSKQPGKYKNSNATKIIVK